MSKIGWVLGIDALNIRSGGGIVHLVEIISHMDLARFSCSRVIIFGEKKVLALIPEQHAVKKISIHKIFCSVYMRWLWYRIIFPRIASRICDVVFVAGGICFIKHVPYIAMCQNRLPFDKRIDLYKRSWFYFRLLLLRRLQLRAFREAAGIVFLTQEFQVKMEKKYSLQKTLNITIPHGISNMFLSTSNNIRDVKECFLGKPFTILYVSTINKYKNQEILLKAVRLLKAANFPVILQLIGSSNKASLGKLNDLLKQYDPKKQIVEYLGCKKHHELIQYYQAADMFVYPSACEAFGLSLLEAMGMGLPIVCADTEAAREIADDSVEYFDCDILDDLVETMSQLILDKNRRKILSGRSKQRAKRFGWKEAANRLMSVCEKSAKSL